METFLPIYGYPKMFTSNENAGEKKPIHVIQVDKIYGNVRIKLESLLLYVYIFADDHFLAWVCVQKKAVQRIRTGIIYNIFVREILVMLMTIMVVTQSHCMRIGSHFNSCSLSCMQSCPISSLFFIVFFDPNFSLALLSFQSFCFYSLTKIKKKLRQVRQLK